MIACVRRLNRIETVGESLRAALEEIAAISPGFVVPLLKEGWDQRYGRKVETSRLLGRKNGSAQSPAEQIGADGRELLDAIDADPAAWMNTLWGSRTRISCGFEARLREESRSIGP